MRVLILGGGGREHAIAWKFSRSPSVEALYCAPGNPGTSSLAQNVTLEPCDPASVRRWAVSKRIDLVVVGPEAPLAAGVAEELGRASVPCLGPTSAAARIETSKAWAKRLMRRAGVPTADFEIFDDFHSASRHLASCDYPLVVKADGLAQGKGVVVAADRGQAESALVAMMLDRRFGDAGRVVVIEECLAGWEVSAFAVTDGESLVMLPCARDFKRASDGDRGPNTGSMGCYSPVKLADASFVAEVESRIMRPTLDALLREGCRYVGFLYAGIMVTDSGPTVLEFNCRLGDPEAQGVLPLLDCDLAVMGMLAVEGRIEQAEFGVLPSATCCVVMSSGGYPGKYATGFPIDGIEDAERHALVFQAGTAQDGTVLKTAGGRVLSAVGEGADLAAARSAAYDAVSRISFEGAHYRTDIGALDPERVAV